MEINSTNWLDLLESILCVEEMTKNLLESDLIIESDGEYGLGGPVPGLAIPTSLQDSFAARLDRLGPVRELAQIGAVLGRSFAYDLVLAVSMIDDPKLQEGLSRLRDAEILFQRGTTPNATYTFKHALLQDAAYNSLLKSHRQIFHARTAMVLEQQFPELQESEPELLAHHFTEADEAEQAIRYWQRAGEKAIQRSANKEAVGHLKRALDVLLTLPVTAERDGQELTLQVALGAPIIATHGFAAAEAGKVYLRARKLCELRETGAEAFPAL